MKLLAAISCVWVRLMLYGILGISLHLLQRQSYPVSWIAVLEIDQSLPSIVLNAVHALLIVELAKME